MSDDVLVVAFDGLDKELIDKFQLTEVRQKEYGEIDNQTGMKYIKTSELFASFITGETYEEHGVVGLRRGVSKLDCLVDRYILPNYLINNLRGFYRFSEFLKSLIRFDTRYYDKRDLECQALFDKIDNSKALFVPSWNRSVFWEVNSLAANFRENDLNDREINYYWDEMEYERRKREFFRPINKWFGFCMMHFHRPDAHQHFFGDAKLGNFDEDKLKEVYRETDDLARKIIDYFEDDYEYIIFMSDHGLPTEKEHNENAFYSCNKELFPDKTPEITDFYEVIRDISTKE